MKSFIVILSVFVVSGSCEFSERSRNFSIELLHYTAEPLDGHVVISPFGVWTLMTGVALGASGKSYDQLQRAFILPKNERALARGYRNLTQIVLNPLSKDVSMSSKNFMFLDKDFPINTDFTRAIQTDFGASIKILDFTNSDSAAKTANSYILNSGGRVSNVLKSDDFANSRMIISNVISFKGLWQSPFNVSDTVKEPFFNENRQQIGEVNMMYQKAAIPFSNIQPLKSFAIELPYGKDGQYSMLIILPYAGVKIADMYKQFEKITLKDVFAQLQKDIDEFDLTNVDIRIPRFKISTNVVLNKPLNDMGVIDIFQSNLANFDRVSREPLFVSAIVHKADIEVTESGTVASASTSANFVDRISSPNFQANKPFLYFVMEKTTTTVIFGGIYSKPTVF